ncbi:hypothetical protein CSUI_008318, partial [Cystoisospora suis]
LLLSSFSAALLSFLSQSSTLARINGVSSPKLLPSLTFLCVFSMVAFFPDLSSACRSWSFCSSSALAFRKGIRSCS